MNPKVERWFDEYGCFLYRHHRLILLFALLVTILAGLSASRFTVKTDFRELLPQNEPSIKDIERASLRVGGLSNMIVAVMGEQPEANRRMVDDLVERFSALPKDRVVYLKYNLKDERDFYERFKHFFVNLEDLEDLYHRLDEKIRYERIKNNPILSMKFDDEELTPVDFDIGDLKTKYEKKASGYDKYLDGYFTEPDGKLYAIMLYPPGSSAGVDFGKSLVAQIKGIIAEVCTQEPWQGSADDLDDVIAEACPRRYNAPVSIGLTGGVVSAIDEQEAIISDLVEVSVICFVLNLLVVLFYFRYWRSMPLAAIPVAMGTTWTFGLSYYIVGSLNTSTAFLAAIIVGNGINFGLIQLARYTEERRQGVEPGIAIIKAMKYTAQSTSVAALAAAISYGSLIITAFRGFNGFGYMGGLGMVLCWISSFTVQPALVVLWEKLSPQKQRPLALKVLPPGWFLRPFSEKIVKWSSLTVAVGGVILVGSLFLSVRYLQDPFEYDFRNLRNQVARSSGSGALSNRIDRIFPRRTDPMFILADRPDQIPFLMEELERNNTLGRGQGLFQEITSIFSFLPADQDKKIKVLRKLDKLLSDSTLSWLTDQQRADVDRIRPPKELPPVQVDDLPPSILRMFTEMDGRRGLIVLLYPSRERSVWDGHFLMDLDMAHRLVQLPDGEQLTSAGVPTVFADMLRAIIRDGPRAILVSLVGVILLVVLVFRTWRLISVLVLSLVFGGVVMLGAAALMDLKLNFLNFIALPITFGIGMDYSVNVLNRYRSEGRGSIARAVQHTGGAVILCSLTTIIGYSSLLIADNRALVSFGLLANIGELVCLAAAIVFLPAVITRFEDRQRRRRARFLRLTSPQPALDSVPASGSAAPTLFASAGLAPDPLEDLPPGKEPADPTRSGRDSVP